jgi:hypothetical protein
MATSGKTLDIDDIITRDQLGCAIANNWVEWKLLRQPKEAEWQELRQYIYATDTTQTSNQLLPWKNTTTTPKLTQIRDNLFSNYMASMFPNPRWLTWEGQTDDDQTKAKTEAIKAYMAHAIDQPAFKDTVARLILDYIDYGNTFAMPDWQDDRVDQEKSGMAQVGYVGPVAVRVAPLDIVFNPIAPSFDQSPKIVRSLVSLGEVKEILLRQSTDDGQKQAAQELFDYLREIRGMANSVGELSAVDSFFQMDGFGSFQQYLQSSYAEVLTFYGDIYEEETGEFYKNHIIQVVDRHKIIRKEPNPSFFGKPPIYYSGWRPRQDNLWAMGPLDNLVGLQYRLDHIENLKADLFDLTAFPPLKITGFVDDFTWAPFEKIVTSEEGNVEIMKIDVSPLQANFELDRLAQTMEEMAGAPKEAMGFRTPGEKTAYEVQSLQNAAYRIFQNKISQFEEQILEPLLNGMLELARRKMNGTTVRILNDEFKTVSFMSISPDDIAGAGRIRPLAARHFVEVSDRVQSITNFYGSGVGQDELVRSHFSSIALAQLFEELLDLSEYKLVTPYIRITEQAEAQQMAQQHQEDNEVAAQTASGMNDDFDLSQELQQPTGAPNGAQVPNGP